MQFLLKGRPDTGREDPAYVAGMVESLSWLTDEERGWISHPRDGLHTVCKFLPTAADVHGFIRDKRARMEASRPGATTYRRLGAESGPWDKETDYERKARIVRELLGYNPSPAGCQVEPKRGQTPPTTQDMTDLTLKTPPAPPSRYLIAQLEADGWPFIPGKDAAA